MKLDELQKQAQLAAEVRLQAAFEQMWQQEEDEPDGRDHPAWTGISSPFCGCDTCIVREVLDAAWPFLKQLALEENGGA